METLVLALVKGLSVALGGTLVYWVGGALRRRGVRRRAEAVAHGHVPHLPVRLRGASVVYPGFWRAGELDLVTATWRPRVAWGVPARLAGVRVVREEPADLKKHALTVLVPLTTVLTCLDARGEVLQIGVSDEAESRVVARCLAASSAAPTEPATAPLRWLRNRAPAFALVMLLLTLAAAGYAAVPLVGAHRVQGEVVTNPGGGHRCAVRWADPATGTGGEGFAGCGDLPAGSPLELDIMGWPRTGEVEDHAGDALLLAIGLLGLIGLGVGQLAWHLRGLRQLSLQVAGADATAAPPRTA